MESVLRKLGGIPIKPKALYKELETGCLRAVPDNDLAAQKIKEFFDNPKSVRRRMGFDTRNAFKKHYQWHLSGKKWEDYFDSVDVVPFEQGWGSPPRLFKPQPKLDPIPDNISHQELARWLVLHALGEPERVNTFFEARLARDLMYQCTTATTGGMYFNENSAAFDGKNTMSPFSFDLAYNHMVELGERRNQWEQRRHEVLKR
jgi:hypothetical protein